MGRAPAPVAPNSTARSATGVRAGVAGGQEVARDQEGEARPDGVRDRQCAVEQPRIRVQPLAQPEIRGVQSRRVKGLHLRRCEVHAEPAVKRRIAVVEMVVPEIPARVRPGAPGEQGEGGQDQGEGAERAAPAPRYGHAGGPWRCTKERDKSRTRPRRAIRGAPLSSADPSAGMRATAQIIRAARWAAAGQLGDHLREFVRTRRRARRIAASPLFDAAWYRRHYEDLGADISDADLALHYLLRGAAEGRSPGPRFDGEWYLRRYPDVLTGGGNPLLHYIEQGQREGRETAPVRAVALPRLALTDANYRRWIAEYDRLDDARRAAVRARVAALRRPGLFSVVLLDPEPGDGRSVLAGQLYPHWELLAGSPEAAREARGDFLIFLPRGVALAKTALAEMALALDGAPDADLLYADEDRIGPDGLRCDPDFKPDWDPDLALGRDLIGPTGAYRRSLVEQAGLPDLAALPEFACRCAARASQVLHVTGVLFHTRSPSPPRISPVRAASLADPAPSVTVIIPTRDRARLLARCVDGLLRRTDYAHSKS